MSNPIDEQTSKTQNPDNLQDKNALQPDFHTAQFSQDLHPDETLDMSLHDLQEKDAAGSINSIAKAYSDEPQADTETDDFAGTAAPQDLPSFGDDASLPQDLNTRDIDNAHISNGEIINETVPDHENTTAADVSNDMHARPAAQDHTENTAAPYGDQTDESRLFSNTAEISARTAEDIQFRQNPDEYADLPGQINPEDSENTEFASIPVDEEPELPPELLERYAQIAQEAERPLYFSPGESLKGRPGDDALKQKKRQLIDEYNEQQKALEKNQADNGSYGLRREPGFENINVTGHQANTILQDSSRRDTTRSDNVGHADKSIFANVGRKLPSQAAERNSIAEDAGAAYTGNTVQNSRAQPNLSRQSAPAQNIPPKDHHDGQRAAPKSAEPKNEAVNKPENRPASRSKIDIKGASTVFLYTRQLLASIFTHSNLGVLMPETASRLGPCFPSSMPIPMFLIGFLSVAPFFWGANYIMEVPPFLSAALSTAALFILGGVCGFLGITRCVAEFSSTRSDPTLHTLIVVLYIVILTASLETLLDEMSAGLQPALCFGAASMLAALSACSLEIGQTSDPVDSFGMLTVKGLVFAAVITLAVVFSVFPPLVAISLSGLALFMRLLLGFYLQRKGIMISRSIVCGMHLSVLIVLLIYIIIAAGRMLI